MADLSGRLGAAFVMQDLRVPAAIAQRWEGRDAATPAMYVVLLGGAASETERAIGDYVREHAVGDVITAFEAEGCGIHNPQPRKRRPGVSASLEAAAARRGADLPAMVETYGMTHIALAVADPVRSAAFYNEVFGCTTSFADESKAELQTPGRHDVISLERAETGIAVEGGIGHFGFRLVRPGDIDAAVEAVLQAGGTVDEQGEFSPGYPYAFVRDLDGYTVEIWFE